MKSTPIKIIALVLCMAMLALTLILKNFNAKAPLNEKTIHPVKIASVAVEPTTKALITEIPFTLPKPLWQAPDQSFSPSSPRLIDLTGDGILDVVMGDIQNDGISIITAINGKSGKEIWKVSGYKDIFTSASFLNIDADTTPDIVMGGRGVDLVAISGLTGKLLWQFKKPVELELWGNFYSSIPVSDQNNDGVSDIITANGGDESRYEKRPPGLFLLISGKTGEVLHKLTSPDGKETYMSPILIESPASNEKFILFGSGGETLPGSVWKITLADLVAEKPEGFKKIITSKTKGFEAPPASADFNNDGIIDYFVQGFDGTATLVDGNTDKVIWEIFNDGFESIAAPTIGYFLGNDTTPDIFLQLNQGVYPEYSRCKNVLIDGKDGKVLWSSIFGKSSTSGSVAIDLNNDGVDEIIFAVNEPHEADGILIARYYVFDTTNKTMTLWNKTNRYAIASTWVGDMDNNGMIDIIMESQLNNEMKTPVLSRFEIKNKIPGNISWGAYMGTTYNGNLQKNP